VNKHVVYIGSKNRAIVKKLKDAGIEYLQFPTVSSFVNDYDPHEDFHLIILDASISRDEFLSLEGGNYEVVLAMRPEEKIDDIFYNAVADIIYDDLTPASIIGKCIDRILLKGEEHRKIFEEELLNLKVEIEEKDYHLRIIESTNKILSKVLHLDELLTAILQLSLDFTLGKAGVILLYEEQSGNYQVKSFIGFDGENISGLRVNRDKGILSHVTRDVTGYLMQSKDELFHWDEILPDEPEFKSFIAYPIHNITGIPAIILIYDKRDNKNLSRKDYEIVKIIADQATSSVENSKLYESIKMNYYNTVRALAIAIEANDPYTRGHSERVSSYAIIIAHTMGLSEEAIHEIEYYAILHDIGKIGIPGEILHKDGALTDSEYEIMKTHSQIGADIIASIGFLQKVTSLIRYHHEHWDGSGYYHLKGEQIPIQARIVGVADAYDAMVSDRPYRKAMSSTEAIVELKKYSGIQFDPAIIKVFVAILERFYHQN